MRQQSAKDPKQGICFALQCAPPDPPRHSRPTPVHARIPLLSLSSVLQLLVPAFAAANKVEQRESNPRRTRGRYGDAHRMHARHWRPDPSAAPGLGSKRCRCVTSLSDGGAQRRKAHCTTASQRGGATGARSARASFAGIVRARLGVSLRCQQCGSAAGMRGARGGFSVTRLAPVRDGGQRGHDGGSGVTLAAVALCDRPSRTLFPADALASARRSLSRLPQTATAAAQLLQQGQQEQSRETRRGADAEMDAPRGARCCLRSLPTPPHTRRLI